MRPALTIEANQPSNNQTIDQSDNHTYNQAVSQSRNATISAASVSSKAKANKRPNENAQLPWHAQVGKRVRTEPTVLNRVTVLDESRRETPIGQSNIIHSMKQSSNQCRKMMRSHKCQTILQCIVMNILAQCLFVSLSDRSFY